MTLAEFIAKWDGKGIDFDGFYGFQCVDLYRQYVQEVLNFPQSPGVTGAKDIWNSYLQSHFERITNTPEGIPEPGDIMIWGDKYGTYGHVAVVTKATLTTFTCFSQNDPIGTLCGVKTYRTYAPVLGWLHPKAPETSYRGFDLTNLESMKVCVDDHLKIVEGKLVDAEELIKARTRIEELTKQTADLSSELGRVRTDLTIANDSLKRTQGALEAELNDQHDWADIAEKEQEAHRKTKKLLEDFLYETEETTKLQHTADDVSTRVSVALGALHSLADSKIVEVYPKDTRLLLVIGGKVWLSLIG